MPVSDCGADLISSRRHRASLASSISPSEFSIMAAKGEASARARSRAPERLSERSVSRCAPMSCSTAITPAALSRGSSAGWNATCTQGLPGDSSCASTNAEAALPSPTRAMFCWMRFWSPAEKSEASDTLESVPRSWPVNFVNARFAKTIPPRESAMAMGTPRDSTMRLKSSGVMEWTSVDTLLRRAELANHVEEVTRRRMQRRFLAAQGGKDLCRDGLPELDTELVERVDAPD